MSKQQAVQVFDFSLWAITGLAIGVNIGSAIVGILIGIAIGCHAMLVYRKR